MIKNVLMSLGFFAVSYAGPNLLPGSPMGNMILATNSKKSAAVSKSECALSIDNFFTNDTSAISVLLNKFPSIVNGEEYLMKIELCDRSDHCFNNMTSVTGALSISNLNKVILNMKRKELYCNQNFDNISLGIELIKVSLYQYGIVRNKLLGSNSVNLGQLKKSNFIVPLTQKSDFSVVISYKD
ncbi:MAG: hypothetical protein JNM24_00985 [Bdellovibrionaceae bacterium]|nr:hypothetical protein [Pseudobdellovibrionaceae bacterium]